MGSSCESTKSSATRWMTFTKIPSPCPVPRVKPERKPAGAGVAVDLEKLEQPRKAEAVEPTKDAKADAPKWEPTRKFSPTLARTEKESGAKNQDEKTTEAQQVPPKESPDSADRSSNLSQRMKELYDFKTENEWPKRLSGPRRGNTWISKSSSEEDKTAPPARRKSQDLEFNERIEQIQLRETKIDTVCPEESKPKASARMSLLERNNEVFDSDFEERLKRFHERLRFSEDLGIPVKVQYKVKGRRTYSDDHEEKTRRASCIVRGEDLRKMYGYKEQKKGSGSSQKSSFDSRASYSDKIPRRKSMGSRSTSSDTEPLKRKSVDSKNQNSEPLKQKSLETRSSSVEAQPPRRKLPDVRGRSWEVDFPPRRTSEDKRNPSTSTDAPKKKPTESKTNSGIDRPRQKPLESRSNSAEGRPTKREIFTSKTQSIDVEPSKRRSTDSRGCSSDVEVPRKKSIESRGSYSDAEYSKRKSVDSRGSYSESNHPKRDSCTSNVSYACSELSKPRASTSTYVEIDFSKRNSRTSTTSYMSADLSKRKVRTSDASYVSVDPHAKRSSMDYRGSRQIELPPRRAFSQTDEKQASSVPPELKDDRQRKMIAERQQRDSTRYKVYLT